MTSTSKFCLVARPLLISNSDFSQSQGIDSLEEMLSTVTKAVKLKLKSDQDKARNQASRIKDNIGEP